ncbi:glycosyltransferase family 2 protein [Candidatus Microgenomates bacterium]|nr:glycosyltransferase family 2 protein [Candidatus Microgenomates bacterium]
MAGKLISIIIPCHNEEKNISPIVSEIKKIIPKQYKFEIILVDDGSIDHTRREIFKIGRRNKNIRGIIFYKNFGQQAALMAGLRLSRGNVVIMMDADFQHPPKYIPQIIKLWEKGYDMVQMQKDSISKTKTRNIGYKLWEWISAGTIIPGASDFRLVDKQIVDYIKNAEENETFLRGLVKQAAVNPILVPYKVVKRRYGKSSYTFKMFVDIFINGFISFSTFPLRVAWLVGILITTVTGTALVIDIIDAIFRHERIVRGYTTLIFLTLILNGFVILYIGILGEYLGVIFREIKRRPKYLIREKINI